MHPKPFPSLPRPQGPSATTATPGQLQSHLEEQVTRQLLCRLLPPLTQLTHLALNWDVLHGVCAGAAEAGPTESGYEGKAAEGREEWVGEGRTDGRTTGRNTAEGSPAAEAAGVGPAAGLDNQLQALKLGPEGRQPGECLGRGAGDSGPGDGGGGGCDDDRGRRRRGGADKARSRRPGLPLLPYLRELSVMWLKEVRHGGVYKGPT